MDVEQHVKRAISKPNYRRVATLLYTGVKQHPPVNARCASKQRSHKTTALVSEPCWILTKVFFLARSKSLATTLLSPAAPSRIANMVEPSVSFMSAFLPKASLLVGLSFAGFYSQQYLKVLGGNLPVRDQMSWRPEHKEAERRRFLNMVCLQNYRVCNFHSACHVKQTSAAEGEGGSA